MEVEGIRRARAHAEAADLVIAVSLVGDDPLVQEGSPVLAVLNKVDQTPGAECPGMISVSARTGAGMDELRKRLA